MIRTISADEAQAAFGDLLASVHDTNDAIIVEQDGDPVAVVISPETFQRFQHLQSQAEQALVTIEEFRSRNAGKDPNEVLDDVTAIVEQVQQGLTGAGTPWTRDAVDTNGAQSETLNAQRQGHPRP
ncbi:MAG: type II toxin-antitoxin system prevent-host-death family antitoxin [Chloroflexota bacterium]|nr:type II toxin-antitoxin system prevent-host-death family antitoxin [Chloroflexota bacterium]